MANEQQFDGMYANEMEITRAVGPLSEIYKIPCCRSTAEPFCINGIMAVE